MTTLYLHFILFAISCIISCILPLERVFKQILILQSYVCKTVADLLSRIDYCNLSFKRAFMFEIMNMY